MFSSCKTLLIQLDLELLGINRNVDVEEVISTYQSWINLKVGRWSGENNATIT